MTSKVYIIYDILIKNNIFVTGTMKEQEQVTFSLGCPTKEKRDSLRKLIRKAAANEDSKNFDVVYKAVTLYNKQVSK